MTRSIKSWILLAILLSLVGALMGALLSSYSITRLSRGAQAISQFERSWSQAVETDIRASDMAIIMVRAGQTPDIGAFERLNNQRANAFLAAVAKVPRNASNVQVEAIYDLVRAKGEVEMGALAFAANQRAAAGLTMLTSPHYAAITQETDDGLTRLRTGLSKALDDEQRQAATLMMASLMVLFLCVLLAGSCWWRVGRLFREQAAELKEAHRELAAHAAGLEAAITERTADLEAAKLAAEAADRAKSAFLAQMSHEIRTPLNGVLGMADALNNTVLDARQLRMLDVVRESGTTLLALLNDVLDLAKIEAGKLELETIPFRASELVASAEAMFTSRAHEKGISLAVRATGDVDAWCLGDPTRLRQVLYNLVSNAVKFTASGGVLIELDVGPLTNQRRAIEFAVRDSGIGMDADAMGRLFGRFAQADASTTRKFGGSGLGLAICQQLLNMMDGSIEVESQAGQGSVFRVRMSLAAASLNDAQGQMVPGRDGTDIRPTSLGGSPDHDGQVEALRILAADDNAHNRLVLQLLLEQCGLVATFAQDGAEAVGLWEQSHFDLVLMDIQMPVMSGHDATRRIRALEAQTGRAHTPVIALTANAMAHHVRECLDAGMDAHVAKPIKPELLFAAMEAALAGGHQDDRAEDSARAAG